MNQFENNLVKYKALENKAKKMLDKAMKDEYEEKIENLARNPNDIFKLETMLNIVLCKKMKKMLKVVNA